MANGPGQALRAMKDNLDQACHLGLSESLDLEAEPQAIIAEMQRMARRFAGSPVVGELDDRHVYP